MTNGQEGSNSQWQHKQQSTDNHQKSKRQENQNNYNGMN